MSNYGAPALSEGMQGPTFSKLGSQISAAKSADVSLGSSLSGGQGMLILFSDMRDSLQTIVDNTLETVSLLKDLVVGDVSQEKKDAIAAGNTDPAPKEKGPGILSRAMKGLKGAFGALVPEKGGLMDTLLKLGLAVGGVALLKYFGDDMVPVLADLLKSIKEGKIGENIQAAYEYIKEIGLDTFEKIRTNTILFIDGAVKVKDFIVSAYKMVNDYIMSFDTQGKVVPDGPLKGLVLPDNKLDKQEFDALKEDLTAKAVTIVGNVISGVFTEFFNFLTSSNTLKSMGSALLLYGPISMIFGNGKGKKGTTAPGKKGGFIRGAGIVTLLAYGIRQTFFNYDQAIRASVDEMGAIDMKEFAINFLGGANNAAGSADAAYKQAKGMGGTGLLVGMAIGSVVPGIGTIVGGVFGAVAGGIIGYLSGAAGTDKIREIVDGFEGTITDMITDMGNFFHDLASGFKSFFTGKGFMKGFNRRGRGDVDEITEKMETQQSLIDMLKKYQAENPGDDFGGAILEAEKELEELGLQRMAAPSLGKFNDFDDMKDKRTYFANRIKNLEGLIFNDPEDTDGDGDRKLHPVNWKDRARLSSGSPDGDPGLAQYAKKNNLKPTNLDALSYYKMQMGRMDHAIYGKSRSLGNDKRAMSMAEDVELTEKTGVDHIRTNQFVMDDNAGIIRTPINGGFGTQGGGDAIRFVDNADNSITNSETSTIFSDQKSFDGKMLHPLYGNYSFPIIN